MIFDDSGRRTDSRKPLVETDTEVHWGVWRPGFGGSVMWDPSYGTGVPQPLTEEEARHAARREHAAGRVAKVVTRTHTTTTVTTMWEEEA